MDSPHAGIDLDTICIDDLVSQKANRPKEEIASDPENYRVFVNSIFKKMKSQKAFLSFSRQINNVNQILNMTYSSADDIARVILKDLALTAQVLKLVNSSFYRQFSQKGISTISEAMIILGTDEVRQIAASLKVYEMMKGLANSKILKEKTLKGLQRSIMARQIAEDMGGKTSDALQISAMVYDLGEYLVALFDPQTYIRVELAMEDQKISREIAAKQIVGLTYSDLGRVVALKLNLPQDVVQAMKPIPKIPHGRTDLAPKETQRYLCAFIKALSDISDKDPCEEAGKVSDTYFEILDIDMRTAVNLVRMSREKMVRHAELLDIDPLVDNTLNKNPGIKDKKELLHGMTRIKDALDRKMSIHKVFTRLVGVMDDCFYFNQVVISIKKKETSTMEPRFFKGDPRPEDILSAMAFKIESGADLFNQSILGQTDMIVRDIKKESYKKQVPSWYLDRVSTVLKLKGFAVFPVR